MIARVEKNKEDKKIRARKESAINKDVIIDPKTGAKYKRIAVPTGKKDILKVSRQNILSPNGKLMLIGHTVIPIQEGEPFDLLEGRPGLRLTWSPNGKAITVISDNKISIIPLVSGKSIKILNLEGKGFTERFWGLIWLPDGKHIAFIGEKEEDKGNLSRRIYIAYTKTGKITELATDDKSWKDWIFLSPDGKWISY